MKTLKIMALATIPNVLISLILMVIFGKGDWIPTWLSIYTGGNLFLGLLLFFIIIIKNGSFKLALTELKIWINEKQ